MSLHKYCQYCHRKSDEMVTPRLGYEFTVYGHLPLDISFLGLG